MKRIRIGIGVLGMLGILSNTYAQSETKYGSGKDSITCVENLAVYQHRYRNEDRNASYSTETLNAWRKTMSICPQASVNMYTPHGTNMMTTFYKNEKDAAKKQQYLDTIIMLYDKRIEHFGEKDKYVGLKGADLLLLDSKQYEQAFTWCKESADKLGTKTDVKTLVMLMQANVLMYANQKHSKTDALLVYQNIAAAFEENIKKGSKAHESQLKNIEAMFLQLKPECEDLVVLFEPQYKEDSENPELLKKIISNLGKTCKSNNLYLEAVVSLDKIEPSAQSKRNIAEMYLEKKDVTKGIAYFNESLKLEEDNSMKAEIYYRMATATSGNLSGSVNYAQSALKINPSMGKAYLFIAGQYISGINTCAENEEYPDVARWTVLWAAYDLCQLAKNVDSSVGNQANSQMANYKANFPDTETLFAYNITEGDSRSISCWFKASTTAKTR